MKLHTDLISGAGNTFHVLYKQANLFLQQNEAHHKMQTFAKDVCTLHKADGLIFLEPASDDSANVARDFKWYFFNNDGSDAEMCGNATRCVGYFIRHKLDNQNESWSLDTVAGPIKIEFVESEKFKITMSPIQKLSAPAGFFCDTGVPHLVLPYTQPDLFENLNEDLKIKSRALRFDSQFQPRGTNVTYIFEEAEKECVKAVSYERGVEDFTEACGTGAMAAAFYNLTKRKSTITSVQMPGGTLVMNLENLNRPTMTGPAVLLGSFDYEISI